ncbi:KilA-N domain-containing protein [Acinetobacter johnsonii]|uniref:KilA-N domain-containing protein n=1 Tax=Acinetobacter johnsonii TaxID=40214 RepID=UPI001B754A25|nr:KilA-N domain-containing protein [Acinetobacter sp.]USI86819.1 KilA-N domain-containing protein [Acinetobacter johnsonii]USI86861.1 KilA-N domain-containing protein [Acinetobacter johnsonii]
MSNLTQNFSSPNNQPLVIGEFAIRQDDEGRYSLADLHKASGNLAKHKPSNFLRVEQTQELIKEIEQCSDISLCENNHFSNMRSAVKVINGGNNRGTYAVKEMVYAYAMWISAKFHLMVIRAYDAMVMQWQISDRKSISPEQQALLHEIVDRRSKGERKIYAEMWSRHNRHFKIPRYAELLAIHFPEAVHYLETMELKAKIVEPKQDLIAVDRHYDQSVQGLAWHMLWVREWWREFGEAIRTISPHMAGAVHDHFQDGAMFAFHFIDKDELKKQRDRMDYYQWHLNPAERMALDYKRK